MRFVHASDFHIGATPDSSFSWSKERRDAVNSALSRVVDLCNNEQADLLLISGDLFNAPPLRKELKEVAYTFSKLKNTKVVLIAGNHDYLTPNSAFLNYDLGENVFFLADSNMNSVYFKDINTEVFGFSYYQKEIKEPLYDNVTAPKNDRINVLLAHGGDANHIPIKYSSLANSGFDYIALGHIHQPKLFKDTHMAYSGCPEPLDHTDIGRRGCFVGNVSKDSFSIMWHPLSLAQYNNFDIVSDNTLTQGALEDAIREKLLVSPSDLLVVNISGTRSPDFEIDKDSLYNLGRVASVIDNSIPEYDLEEIIANHSGDIISYFIQTLNKKDATPEMKKALYYGLKVLLKE